MFFAEWKLMKNLAKLRYVIAPLYILLALEISSDEPHKQRWGGSSSVTDQSWDLGQFFKALGGKISFKGAGHMPGSGTPDAEPYQVSEVFEAWLEFSLWLLAFGIFGSQFWLACTLESMTDAEWKKHQDQKKIDEIKKALDEKPEK